MNTLERFYIYNETKIDNQINDKGTVKLNILFDKKFEEIQVEGIPHSKPPVYDTDLIQLQANTPANNQQHRTELPNTRSHIIFTCTLHTR